MGSTFQERVRELVDLAGGRPKDLQTRAAALGCHVTVAAIQNLMRTRAPRMPTKRPWKPATTSRFSAQLALAVGVRPEWLATGVGPKFASDAGPRGLPADIAAKMLDSGFTAEDWAEALNVSLEEAASYMAGKSAPNDRAKLRKIANLLRLDPESLTDPRSGGPLAESEGKHTMVLTYDEKALVEIYRELKPFGQKAMRKRAVELQQEFLPKSAKSPWGEPNN